MNSIWRAARNTRCAIWWINSMQLIGKNIKPKIAPIRPGDIKHSYADVVQA